MSKLSHHTRIVPVGIDAEKVKALQHFMYEGLPLNLEREPTNKHDPQAIYITMEVTDEIRKKWHGLTWGATEKLGYLPREVAAQLNGCQLHGAAKTQGTKTSIVIYYEPAVKT